MTGGRLPEEFCRAGTVLIFYLGADCTSVFNMGTGAATCVLLFGCYSSMRNLKRWMGVGTRKEEPEQEEELLAMLTKEPP